MPLAPWPVRSPIRRAVWIIAPSLAAIHAWAVRHFVNPDGVSYLDLSDDYLAGRWSAAVNAYWSPLYPWLLSVANRLVQPSRYWEATVTHALNAMLFIASLAAFDFLLAEIRRSREPRGVDDASPILNTPSGLICAYAVFLLGGLSFISPRVVTPDMVVAALIYAMAALLVRVRRELGGILSPVLLGAVLGTSYLAKAVMFPMSLIVLPLSYIANRSHAGALKRHAVAATVFALIAAPQVVAVSRVTGGLSFASAGSIAYGLKVNRYPKHWVGEPPGSGRPIHPVTALSVDPVAWLFPIEKASRAYPPWDEPAYWYAGMTPHFSLSEQMEAVRRTTRANVGALFKILVPVVILLLLARDAPFDRRNWILLAIPAAAIGLYSLVHSEPRLIGSWVALGVVGLLSGVSITPGARDRAALRAADLLTLVCLISVTVHTLRMIVSPDGQQGLGRLRHAQWDVARKLDSMRIPRGARVALVGDESDIYWTRLAGVQVAMQVPLAEAARYWQMPDSSRAALDSLFAENGAAAIVASWTRPSRTLPGWLPVEHTEFSILPLPAGTNTSQ